MSGARRAGRERTEESDGHGARRDAGAARPSRPQCLAVAAPSFRQVLPPQAAAAERQHKVPLLPRQHDVTPPQPVLGRPLLQQRQEGTPLPSPSSQQRQHEAPPPSQQRDVPPLQPMAGDGHSP